MVENRGGEQHDLAGRTVADRFLLGERLSEGSIWTMHLAHDVTTGQRVAVKVLREDVAVQPEASTRFLKQAEDGFKLDHPNIVRSLATGSEGGYTFLITELVQGRNIRQWFNDEHRDFNRLREKLKVLCETLLYAHGNGILHRSLKPENLLIDENDTLRVADFGFARRLEGETRAAPGESSNVAYITPEQAKGQRGDARSDLYSLGVLLYELATGKVPFWAPDPVRIVFKHINEVPIRPRHINPKVPAWVEHIVMRLLQKEPAQRFATAHELADEIGRLERHGEADLIELDASDSALARRVVAHAPLVGREREESLLRDLLARVAGGEGVCVLVHGSTGTGKTRLLCDMASYANLMGFSTLRGLSNGREHGPLAPFLMAVRQYLRGSEQRVKDVINDESGTLDTLLEGRVDQVLGADPLRTVSRAEELVTRFIEAVAQNQPTMLVIEHIEATDLATLRVIRRLASGVAGRRLMVALTWRDDETALQGEARALVDGLSDLPAAHLVALRPLDRAGVAELLSALVGADRVEEAVVDAVCESSDGLPLHVEETLAVLMRDKVVTLDEGLLHFSAREGGESPEARVQALRGLRSVFESRVATLPEKVATLLTVASCIGPTFDFEVLMKVSGKPQDEVISILQWALRNHLIEEERVSGREGFRFRYDALQAALHGCLDERSRRRIHLLVGGATEEAFGPRLPEAYESLAHHFEMSEQYEKAVEYAIMAADRFHQLGELEWSERWYARAQALFDSHDRVPVERRLHVLKRLAQLERARGDEPASRLHAERALQLAREHDEGAELDGLQTFLLG